MELVELNSKYQSLQVGPLGIVALEGSKELSSMIDSRIIKRRKDYLEKMPNVSVSPGFLRDTFQISSTRSRFASGEGKASINETVRGFDLYLIVDVCNYSIKYDMFGMQSFMSPDDHFQDIKRTIAAIGGKANHITVIMPRLYEGRQHRKYSRESLDCAIALQELERLGVSNIITFDAHDPRVQNAIPLKGFENISPAYQVIKALIEKEQDLDINKSKMLVVSPDEGGVERSLYYASILGLNLNLFYKRRDYTRIVNGRNPIIKHEFLGQKVEGKDVLIVDDELASGESILDIARELKSRKANRIYIAVTFALFTNGIKEFEKCYNEGIISRIYATNLTYRREELKSVPWFVEVDMSDFVAYLIDMLNYNQSISSLFDPSEKIDKLLKFYNISR